MAAANFSRDVLEMFFGSNESKQGLPTPILPTIGEFKIERNNFNGWMRIWRKRTKKNNKDLFKFFQKEKDNFINVSKQEVETNKSLKIQFTITVRFYVDRDGEREYILHYFNRMQPVILNEHNMDVIKPVLNQFVEQVKGEIEAWSERGSGWIFDEIVEAYIHVAQYQPLRGGSFMVLPTKLKNKKAILNIQNRDN